jgi:hypothetical protein
MLKNGFFNYKKMKLASENDFIYVYNVRHSWNARVHRTSAQGAREEYFSHL